MTTPTNEGQGGTGGGTPPPGSNTDTEGANVGGSGGGTGAGGPNATQPDTTSGALTVGPTGDTDDHSHDPSTTPPDTTVGGGGINVSSNPAYRAPTEFVPASNLDTSGRAGVLTVNSGSPDAALVGDASGINPNAVEPPVAPTTGSYSVGGTRDTSYIGSGLSGVPAGTGTPTAPGKPTVAAVTGRIAATVTWTAPGNASATGVLGYVVETNTGGTMRVGKDATHVEFEQGLVPGDTYTFTVYAVTANGSGARSAVSDPFTVPKVQNLLSDTTPDYGVGADSREGLPGTPAAPVATGGNAQASVAFTAPTSDGGSPITEYTVVSTPGGITKVGTGSPLVVTGLTNDTAYTFKVKAKNGYGYGALSPASNSVTPAAP
jgi:hypothetical protein